MINHNAMLASVYVFPLLSAIDAAIFEATKIAATGPKRNRNCQTRKQTYAWHCDWSCPFKLNKSSFLFPFKIQSFSSKHKLHVFIRP
jgi:hypothetical protein